MLDGRQSKGLRLAEMLGDGPVDWVEQRGTWRFILDPWSGPGRRMLEQHPTLPARTCSCLAGCGSLAVAGSILVPDGLATLAVTSASWSDRPAPGAL